MPRPWTPADTTLSIPEQFERRAREQATKTAIAGTAWQPSFAELDAAADGLAARLLERTGASPGRVAVLMRHDAPLIAAVLGVLKAGKTVLVLNPSDPAARLAQIRADVEPQGVLVDEPGSALALRAGFTAADSILVAERPEPGERVPDARPGPDELAALIYTSGSTGRPNGVMQPHRNVLHNVLRLTNGLGVREEDRLLLLASLSSGQGMATTWLALLNGATLCPFPIMARGVTGLPAWIGENGVSILVLSASVFRSFVRTLDGDRLAGIRLLRLGSEAALPSDYEAYRRYFPLDCLFANTYSSSEAGNVTQFVAGPELEPTDGALPIGTATQDLEVVLLDDRGNEAELGEIVVRSAHLSPGYWGDEQLTARRFGDGAFHTGDLGRISEDGLLTWVGRKDAQVKVRGSRVDLSEVDAALGALPGVQAAVTGPRPSPRGDTRLAAYVIPEQVAAHRAGALREGLRRTLPDHAVPTAFAFLDSFPLNAHGKIDRQALAALELEPAPAEAAEPASGETEEAVARIWRDAFERDDLGREDDFFALGGDSLTAAVVAAGLHAELGVQVELGAFADSPTVAAMAELVDGLRSGGAAPSLARISREGPLPLSFAEERTWRHSLTPEESAGYTVAHGVRIQGPLDVALLQRCLGRIVRRHEVLRTTYAERAGEPVRIVHPPALVEVPLRAVSSEEEAERVFREESGTAFDLERGPLVRMLLLRLGEDDHHLLRLNHHIISDGPSWHILFEELERLYEAERRGEPPPLAEEEPLHYTDFAAWERTEFTPGGERWNDDVAWWSSQLAGAPRRTPLPFARRRPDEEARAADGVVWFGLDAEVSRALNGLGQTCGATYFMVRVAALAALLAAENGDDDVVIGTYASTRRLPETTGMFGFFSNLAALRLRFGGNPGFADWVATVRRAVTDMSAHSQIPYGELCDELRVGGVDPPELHAIFGASAIMPLTRFGGLELTPLYRHFGSMPWGFTMQLDPVWEADRCLAVFDARVNDPDAVRAFIDRYKGLLAAVGAEPERPLHELLPSRPGRLSRLLRRARTP